MGDPEDVQERIPWSEDLKTRLDRHNRTLDRFYFWSRVTQNVAIPLLLVLFLAFALWPTFVNTPLVSVPLLGVSAVVAVALYALQFLRTRFRKTSYARLLRRGDYEGKLYALRAKYPELVVLLELIEQANEEKDEAAAQRDFWASVAQNLFFLVLGFLISYALARLGWLR